MKPWDITGDDVARWSELPMELALAGQERGRQAEAVRGWARTAGRDARALRRAPAPSIGRGMGVAERGL